MSGEHLETTWGDDIPPQSVSSYSSLLHETADRGAQRSYSEQLVRLGGQAIWYNRIVVPSDITLDAQGAPRWPWETETKSGAASRPAERGTVYICPQSVF